MIRKSEPLVSQTKRLRRIFFTLCLLYLAIAIAFGARCSNGKPPYPSFTIAWNTPVLISEEESEMVLGSMIGYAIAVHGSNVHTTWMSARTPTVQEIFYRRSDNGGDTWNPYQKLTTHSVSPSEAVIAALGHHVYLAWRDVIDAEEGSIYFKHSTDNGGSWSQTQLLSPQGIRSAAPTIAVKGDTVFVAFEYYDLGCGNTRIRRSNDRGETWDPPIDATREEQGGGCPSLTAGNGDQMNLIHCSLKDAGTTQNYNWELYYRDSTDNGSTWSDSTRLTNDQIGDSRFPTSASSGDYIHMVWWDDRDDTKYPHYGYPPITPEPDHNFEIYYKRFSNGGASWEGDVRLTSASGVAQSPSVASTGSRVYVVWQDNRDGNHEIYFKYSWDNGVSWSEDIRLTSSLGISKSPSIATDPQGNVYIVYTDTQSGVKEIFFMKGTPIS